MHLTIRNLTLFLAATAGAALGIASAQAVQGTSYPERPIELIVPMGSRRRRRPTREADRQADGADGRAGRPGGERGGRHRRDRHGEASVGAGRRLFDGDLHRRQPRAARRQETAMEDGRHRAGRGDDPGPVIHLRGAGQPIQDLGRFREGGPGQSRQAEDRDARLRQRRRFLAQRRSRRSGIKFVQVPFSKPSERYVSILGGHADALYEQAGDVAPFLHGKQMRPILMFGEKRLPAFKDVPTSYELGFKVALPQFRAIVVRAGTPPERVKMLSDALAKVAPAPEYKKFLRGAVRRGRQLRRCGARRRNSSTSSSRT